MRCVYVPASDPDDPDDWAHIDAFPAEWSIWRVLCCGKPATGWRYCDMCKEFVPMCDDHKTEWELAV